MKRDKAHYDAVWRAEQALRAKRKNGGGAYQDPETEHIKDWNWKPLKEVQEKHGLTEIPSHVEKFGRFMDETAQRAALKGLTPRDLIKAYTIARASIQRKARPALLVRKSGLILPSGIKDEELVRPEGAFGHWLHTKHGQKYLDEAEAGRTDEESIADASQKMAPFGKHEKDIPDALRWAAENLPGKEARVSELVKRAWRGQSDPSEWRDEMKWRGIGSAKSGFLGSLLARGDQPTLDARQIVEHTGRPTAEASPYLARMGGKGGQEAVQRLAARQTAMDLKTPSELKPFYQHLAHHAFWDKAGNDTTTHSDVIDALQTAKRGGRVAATRGGRQALPTSEHFLQGMARAGFPGMAEAHRQALANPEQFRRIIEGVHSPFSDDPESVKKALEVSQSLKVPIRGRLQTDTPYYNINQPKGAHQVKATVEPLPGVRPKEKRFMSWEDLHREGGGGHFINLGGDRSRSGVLTHVQDKKLAWPVKLYAGPSYMQEYNPGSVWASAPGPSSALLNLTKELSKSGKPVYGMYAPMGAQSADSAHHMFDALMAQVPGSNIDPKVMRQFDNALKSGAHIMGNDIKDVAKRKRAREIMKDWPGLANAREASKFAEGLTGEHRAAIVKFMDKTPWLEKGLPPVGMTRVAITDPDVWATPGNMVGHRVVRLDPDRVAKEKLPHTTYKAPTAGEYVGELPPVQRQYAMPDPMLARAQIPAAGGRLVHPYSSDQFGRSTTRKLFEEQKQVQQLSPEQLDNVSQGLARQGQYGLARGGRAGNGSVMTRPGKADGGTVDMGSTPYSAGEGPPGEPGQGAKKASGIASMMGSGSSGTGTPGNPANAKEFLGQLANDPKTDPTTRVYAAGSLSSGAYTGSQGQEATKPSMADGGAVSDDPAPPPQPQQIGSALDTPSYIKPIDEGRRTLSPIGLYSHAAEETWKQPQMKGSPAQFKAMLLKRGVKPDEFKWSGYDQAFAGKNVVTKREVRDHFVKHLPKIEETEHSDKNYDYADDTGPSGGPKYADYQLPGGKNYREVVLHLPKKIKEGLPSGYMVKHVSQFTPEERRLHGNGPYTVFGPPTGGGNNMGSFGSATTEAGAISRALNHEALSGDANYQSSHWDEPNPLLHLRMSDRKGAQGEKILHLEELQSDWGQEARDQGIKQPLSPAEREEMERLGSAERYNAVEATRFHRLQERDKGGGEGVPAAPYIDSTAKWTDLGLKRALHEAARGGYDKLVVTPGEEQAKRYDLSKYIKHVDLHDNSSGGMGQPEMQGPFQHGLLMARDHQGKEVLSTRVNSPEDIARHIGKEAAEKLLNVEPYQTKYAGLGVRARSLSDQDLKVGGEGMKGFYDTILPKALEKLAKQHDPEARVRLHDQPAAAPNKNIEIRNHGDGYHWVDRRTNEPVGPVFRTIAEAGQHGHGKSTTTHLHALDITPRMRAGILAGQKGYASGGRVGRADGGAAPDARTAAFNHLARSQRDKPEWAMLRAQKTLGGGVMSVMLEHIGDLTHRMAEYGGRIGRDQVAPKVERGLRYLNSPYGFHREHRENMAANKVAPEDEKKVLKDYVDEHNKLPAYNAMQFAGRQAAVALGRGSYDIAAMHLNRIKGALDDGSYEAKAMAYDPNYDRKDKAAGGRISERLHDDIYQKLRKTIDVGGRYP